MKNEKLFDAVSGIEEDFIVVVLSSVHTWNPYLIVIY